MQIEIIELESLSKTNNTNAMNLFVINNTDLANLWIEYVESCQNRLDIYEFIEANGISNFNSNFILSFCKFLEVEGDHNPSLQYDTPIFDYRYTL